MEAAFAPDLVLNEDRNQAKTASFLFSNLATSGSNLHNTHGNLVLCIWT